jgi:hypothetical protein
MSKKIRVIRVIRGEEKIGCHELHEFPRIVVSKKIRVIRGEEKIGCHELHEFPRIVMSKKNIDA